VIELEVVPVVEGAQAKYAELGEAMHRLREVCGSLSASAVDGDSGSRNGSPARAASPRTEDDARLSASALADGEEADAAPPAAEQGGSLAGSYAGELGVSEVNAALDKMLASDDDES
jgi:hypothetical protein